jgi:protein-tyrosine-phosphatase
MNNSSKKYLGEQVSFLAVCTGNICRSPMAEGILRTLSRHSRYISPSSAGTDAMDGNHATEFAILASREKGVDISDHRARTLDAALINTNDVILCMELSHVELILSLDNSACKRVFNLAEFAGQPGKKKIADPYGCSLREYRLCFEEINRSILNFFKKS